MQKYLYLLAFKSRPYFKIGVSIHNFNRIFEHDKNYTIDYNNSHIVTSSKKIITSLESELLMIYPRINNTAFMGIDGYTEIRDIMFLNECIDYIKYKHINLGIKIYNAEELINNKPSYNPYLKKNIEFDLSLLDELFKEWGLMEITEYSQLTGISDKTVRNRIKAGKLPYKILGKTIFIIKSLD